MLAFNARTDNAPTANKDFGNGRAVSLAGIGTDANKPRYVTPEGSFTGRATAAPSAKWIF